MRTCFFSPYARYNKFQKSIFHAKEEFYIILIYSSSPRSILKKPQQIFHRKSQKLGAIKMQIFSLTFLLFFQTVQLSGNLLTHLPRRYYYNVTKERAVKRSGN